MHRQQGYRPRSSSTSAVACSKLVVLVTMQFVLCSLRLAAGPRSPTCDGVCFFFWTSRLCGDVREEPSMANSCWSSRARGWRARQESDSQVFCHPNSVHHKCETLNGHGATFNLLDHHHHHATSPLPPPSATTHTPHTHSTATLHPPTLLLLTFPSPSTHSRGWHTLLVPRLVRIIGNWCAFSRILWSLLGCRLYLGLERVYRADFPRLATLECSGDLWLHPCIGRHQASFCT